MTFVHWSWYEYVTDFQGWKSFKKESSQARNSATTFPPLYYLLILVQGAGFEPIEVLFTQREPTNSYPFYVSCEDEVLYKLLVPTFGSGAVWFFGSVFFSSCVGMGKAAFFLISYVGWVGWGWDSMLCFCWRLFEAVGLRLPISPYRWLRWKSFSKNFNRLSIGAKIVCFLPSLFSFRIRGKTNCDGVRLEFRGFEPSSMKI